MANFTKNAIKKSFTELLQKKPLNKITVQELTDLCGIGRNTFYYHYHDIYEVLDEMLEDHEQILIQRLKNIDEEEIFNQTIQYLYENKITVYHIYNCVDAKVLDQYLQKIYTNVLNLYLQKCNKDELLKDDEIKFMIKFLSYAFTGVTMDWISKGLDNNFIDDFDSNLHKYLNATTLNKLLD